MWQYEMISTRGCLDVCSVSDWTNCTSRPWLVVPGCPVIDATTEKTELYEWAPKPPLSAQIPMAEFICCWVTGNCSWAAGSYRSPLDDHPGGLNIQRNLDPWYLVMFVMILWTNWWVQLPETDHGSPAWPDQPLVSACSLLLCHQSSHLDHLEDTQHILIVSRSINSLQAICAFIGNAWLYVIVSCIDHVGQHGVVQLTVTCVPVSISLYRFVSNFPATQ